MQSLADSGQRGPHASLIVTASAEPQRFHSGNRHPGVAMAEAAHDSSGQLLVLQRVDELQAGGAFGGDPGRGDHDQAGGREADRDHCRAEHEVDRVAEFGLGREVDRIGQSAADDHAGDEADPGP